MTNDHKKTQSLEIAFINEVTGEDIKDILADGAEVTLDQFINNDVLKDIPFFGVLYKGYKTVSGIRDAIFAKKVFRFLTELREIPQEKRQQFIKELDAQQEYRQKVGEKLIVLIDQLDEIDKAQIIGKLFKATIEGQITYGEFLRSSAGVQKLLLHDLTSLDHNNYNWPLSVEAPLQFANAGFYDLELSDTRREERRLKSARKIPADMALGESIPQRIRYVPNKLFELLMELGLGIKKEHTSSERSNQI